MILCFDKFKIKRGDAAFICQNPSFDRAFFCQLIDSDKQELLNWPYHWLDLASMYWATSLKQGRLPWETGFSKDRIAAVYQIGPEKKPHRAINGVDHLLSCVIRPSLAFQINNSQVQVALFRGTCDRYNIHKLGQEARQYLRYKKDFQSELRGRCILDR